ncbi:MAG: DUF547 domain-containing protein, partial [Kordiimonadaceae bacterium]|nr:DUF547 domain-containing protein [Kordiimonadaceae bacterium]
MLRLIIIFCLSLLFIQTSQADEFDHSIWDDLLKSHVVNLNEDQPNQATAMDYDALSVNQTALQNYLEQVSKISKSDFDNWPVDERLAFLLNVYNAATAQLVLTAYPDIKSIRDIGSFFNSPFRKDFISLFGETISLDDIEKGMVTGDDNYNDPRAHFALNCASISCPALRREAYSGVDLNEQLNEQMRAFLVDRSRNQLEGNTLRVSKIFDWYDDDFESGWMNIER